MNVGAMIVAELKRRRTVAEATVESLDKLIAEFSGTKLSGKIKAVGKKPRTPAQKAAIAKAQAARRIAKEKKGVPLTMAAQG